MSGKAKGAVKGITATIDAVIEGLSDPSPSTGTLPKKNKGAANPASATSSANVSTANVFETLSDNADTCESMEEKIDFIFSFIKELKLKNAQQEETIKQLSLKTVNLEK